jgi:hypothetical protein
MRVILCYRQGQCQEAAEAVSDQVNRWSFPTELLKGLGDGEG